VSAAPRPADARSVALKVLTGVERGGRSDRLLDRWLRAASLEPRDRALATEIVYGSLRRQGALDACMREHVNRPLGELDPRVRSGLRMGAYQVLHLRSVPPHAAVDRTVAAVKALGSRGGGLVNAALRSWLRAGGEPAPAHDDAGRWNVPQWIAERWATRYGRKRAGRWFESALEPPVAALRVHPRRALLEEVVAGLAAADVVALPSAWCPDALRLNAGRVVDTAAFRDGSVTPHSEAAQLVADLLSPGHGPVLDACAGRGGKAVQLLERQIGSSLVALDLHRARLRDARRAAGSAGLDGLHVVQADAGAALPLACEFQRILLDVPCSGLGTLRRHPEIRWRVRPRQLKDLAQQQRRILDRCLSQLAPGGELLYVTCSTEPEENEEVVAAVLERRADCRALPLRAEGPVESLIGEDGFLRTYPDEPDLDGFFAALLTRI
jgi:16S rRNA (cytosine967-C5)-methyltransferase